MSSPALAALRAALEALDLAAASAEVAEDRGGTQDAWRALIDGRCSLVQSFDADGHRFLIARRNPPGGRSAAGLSAFETRALRLRARSNSYKVIAEELGLSTAAAHGLVRAGMRKLGVQDETELPWLFFCHNSCCADSMGCDTVR